jgi:apolipoprotein N-acyltransferase
LARLRAAENGRWFACAASSGVSQVIDPHGHVQASLPPMETGAFSARIGRRTGLTVFTRVGWLLPWLALAGTVGFSLFVVAATLRRRRAAVADGDPAA